MKTFRLDEGDIRDSLKQLLQLVR